MEFLYADSRIQRDEIAVSKLLKLESLSATAKEYLLFFW